MLNHKHVYFLTYASVFIVYGSLTGSIGPMIPFFALATGHDETTYSFIFLSRALGYIIGGLIVK
jgi:hypothetical protein